MNLPEFSNSNNDDLPLGFDAELYPILARHWLGLPEPTAQVRHAQVVRHLHRLVPYTPEPRIMGAR